MTKPSPAGTEVLDGAELFVALAGLIDLDKERARLEKEIARAEKGLAGSANKLKTEKFVNNDKANQLLTRPYREPFVVPEKV